jgi:2-iminoacetate synthase ThiH
MFEQAGIAGTPGFSSERINNQYRLVIAGKLLYPGTWIPKI